MKTKHHIHYALDEDGNLVSIEQAKKGCRYFCIHCHQEMIVKKGEVREHHFSHKRDNPDCCWESFLHSLAKLKIYEWLVENQSISLSIVSVCKDKDTCPFYEGYGCRGERKTFDLKQLYYVAGVEKNFGGFIPDILLEKCKDSTKDPLFVEIFVTHSCSTAKINSGNRIIEFKIDSEEDIENIVSSPNICESNKVVFYNFINPSCTNAKHEVARCIIYYSGKAHLDLVYCNEIKTANQGICQVFFPIQMADLPNMYQRVLSLAHDKGVNFKSCSLCEFSEYKERYRDRICRLYKIRHGQFMCKDNDPNECERFRIGSNHKVLSSNISSIPYVLKNNVTGEIYYHSALNSEIVEL